MSKYKPGQLVRLKSWDELKEICEECESGDLYNHEEDQYSHFWNKNLHGKEYEIEEIDGKVVLLEGEGWVYSWEIEPIEEKPEKYDHVPDAKKKVDIETFQKEGTKAWKGKNAQEWVDEIRGRKNPKKRTWEITTEARSSDGITVTQDGLKIKYGGSPECLGHLEIDTNAKNCRELMNKLRKGLEMLNKLNK